MKSLIITGSNGFIGSELVQYFSEKGWTVKALARAVPQVKIPGVAYCSYDLSKQPDETMFRNSDYLIHCAYAKYDQDKNSDSINYNAAKQLAEVCRKYNIKPVFLSSFSAHEDAKSHYGKNKLALEAVFDPASDLIFKVGLVLSNTGGFLQTIAEVMQKNSIVPLFDGGNQPLQYIDLDELCAIAETGIEKNISGNFHIANPAVILMKDFYSAIAAKLNRKITFFPCPVSLAFAACKIIELTGMKFPINSENFLGLKALRSFDNREEMKKFNVPVKPLPEILNKYL